MAAPVEAAPGNFASSSTATEDGPNLPLSSRLVGACKRLLAASSTGAALTGELLLRLAVLLRRGSGRQGQREGKAARRWPKRLLKRKLSKGGKL